MFSCLPSRYNGTKLILLVPSYYTTAVLHTPSCSWSIWTSSWRFEASVSQILKQANWKRHQLAVRGRRGIVTPCSMLLQTWSPGGRGSVTPRTPLEEAPPRVWPTWSWRASYPTPLVCSDDGFLLAVMMPETGRYTHKKDDGICNNVCNKVKWGQAHPPRP